MIFKIKNYQAVFLLMLPLLGLVVPMIVGAVPTDGGGGSPGSNSLVPCGTAADPEMCTLCHLWEMAERITNFIVLYLATPVAVILFVVAGIFYMTSGGNETRMNKARSIFFNALIGITVVFCAWLIVDTILTTITAGSLTWAWNSFPDCAPLE